MAPETLEILSQLIGFRTISRQSNLELLDYVEGLLVPAGATIRRYNHPDGSRANLWATVGPEIDGGVVLSGHSDVVPTTSQSWTSDPFILREDGERWYGRGTADMKGFVAVAILSMMKAGKRDLLKPLHLALSYDEEVGCLGVRGMIESLANEPLRPAFCLVGEPTGMRIATGHKGKTALRACCKGQEAHSALAPNALNALHLGAAFLQRLQMRQHDIACNGVQDLAYTIPYTTIHAGIMRGGEALNIVPGHCEIDFEIRNISADDPGKILVDLDGDVEAILAPYRDRFADASITIEKLSSYPGLDTPEDSPIVTLVAALLDTSLPTIKVAFGTEGGLFSQGLDIPVLVCGPGDMAQGHKPDEYVELSQIDKCAAFLDRVIDILESPNSGRIFGHVQAGPQ
ncbi:acetylornithine deacetylase (plasmid) [Rhizobium bangladeshense]|uniref:acetylornithine deacetylase n=1 Tax=Rhizobium bangladeshense TaxID=1138189 RepID=UPI001A991D53|nr:acetylornithine deacetylase [Rhizobium bangladeshense]QSY98006.1 acetylornithine deacetylase [Rhizobium bangladeshense]